MAVLSLLIPKMIPKMIDRVGIVVLVIRPHPPCLEITGGKPGQQVVESVGPGLT